MDSLSSWFVVGDVVAPVLTPMPAQQMGLPWPRWRLVALQLPIPSGASCPERAARSYRV